ncbi:MAG: ketoacyl-ACP synthase III [Endomicrobiaceae bacterium]|nr:ketoacyl-ACP synthase III [Endomicrobiaceae bacterium]MDD4166950.1 ketoacyl-ACP synthase III [Endomicrobiaceae bacterium]
MNKFNVKILGTGSYVPEKVLTNSDLEKMVDTSDQWITERTGIKERRIIDKSQNLSDLAFEASKKALEKAKMQANQIDVIIVATVSGEMPLPATACILQKKLGINAVAFDISAACSGFMYGLSVAKSFIESGTYKTVLLVGGEVLTRITDWTDRNTCVLFGDGAGAMVLQASETENNVLSLHLGADGNYTNLLNIPAGGTAMPTTHETVDNKLQFIKMAGKEVFKIAVVKMAEAAQKALELAGKKDEDIALYIPHQANLRIIEAVGKRLGVDKGKVYVNVHKYGNMSSATTIIALDEAINSGAVKKDDIITVMAFGGGLTWGAAVLKI